MASFGELVWVDGDRKCLDDGYGHDVIAEDLATLFEASETAQNGASGVRPAWVLRGQQLGVADF
ncbi:MAG: hypothetical protein ACJ796_07890 [Gemmatimonadaceae bacterium]